MPSAAVQYYVDGGVLGRNPSPDGIYFSVAELLPNEGLRRVCTREKDTTRHTNNEAEWLAVRRALKHARRHHAKRPVVIYTDSKLVAHQFCGLSRINAVNLIPLAQACRMLAEKFPECWVLWKQRAEIFAVLGH